LPGGLQFECQEPNFVTYIVERVPDPQSDLRRANLLIELNGIEGPSKIQDISGNPWGGVYTASKGEG